MQSTDLATTESWLTPTGLRALPDDLPYEEWERIGEALGGIHTACQWALGDWIRFGETHYGEKYAQALDVTKRSLGGLMNIVSLCEAYPDQSSRAREVPIGVYEAVAPIARKDAQEAQDILERAEAGQWTAERARAELRPTVTPQAKLQRFTVAEIRGRFESWPERAEHRNNLNKGMAAFLEWLT